MKLRKYIYILIPTGVYVLFLLAYWFIFAHKAPAARPVSMLTFILYISFGVACSLLMKLTRKRKVVRNIIYAVTFMICLLLSYQMTKWTGADFASYIWYAVLSFFYGRVVGQYQFTSKAS